MQHLHPAMAKLEALPDTQAPLPERDMHVAHPFAAVWAPVAKSECYFLLVRLWLKHLAVCVRASLGLVVFVPGSQGSLEPGSRAAFGSPTGQMLGTGASVKVECLLRDVFKARDVAAKRFGLCPTISGGWFQPFFSSVVFFYKPATSPGFLVVF